MTRQEKDQCIDQLAEKLDANKNIYLTDISGLTVDASNKLRRLCFSKGVKLEVVKNTLLRRAMEKVEINFEESYELLVGNTALMFSESGSLPAKVIKEFRKKNDKPILKGAYVDSSFYLGDEQVKELSSIKSKDELIGEIIALLQSPAKNVISALQSGGNTLSGILKTLGDRTDVSDETSAKSEDAVAEPTSDAPAAQETKEEATDASAEAPAKEEASAEAASEESTEAPTEAKEEVTEESADAGETTEATVEATEEASAEESTEDSSNDESTDASDEAKEEESSEEDAAEKDDESTEASTEAKEENSSDSDESSDPSAEDEEKKD